MRVVTVGVWKQWISCIRCESSKSQQEAGVERARRTENLPVCCRQRSVVVVRAAVALSESKLHRRCRESSCGRRGQVLAADLRVTVTATLPLGKTGQRIDELREKRVDCRA